MSFVRTALGLLFLLTPLLFVAAVAAQDQSVSPDDPVSDDAPMTGDPGLVGADADTGVHGVVADPAGRPIPDAGIAVTAGTSPVPEMLWLTADDGRYFLPLPAGTFSVSATRDGYRQQVRTVTVVAGEIAILDFRLDPGP